MNLIGILRRLMRVAAWLHPHVQAWNHNRQRNRREADRHTQAGNFGEAEKSLRLVLAEAKSRRKPAWKVGSIQLELAAVLLKLDKVDEAESLVQQTITAFGRAITPGLEMQARIATLRSKHANAQELLKQAIHQEEARAKPDLAVLGKLQQELATSQSVSGDLDDAEKTQRIALDRLEQFYGVSHSAVADAKWILGDIYLKEGKHQLAMVCFEGAMAVHRTVEGDSRPVTRDLMSLAQAAMGAGDVARATTEYERTLSMMERQVGTKQTDVAHVVLNLARIYEASYQIAKAQEAVQQAIGLLESEKGQQLAEALELMGRLYIRSGRYSDALSQFEQAQRLWMERDSNAEQLAVNAQQQQKLRDQMAEIEAARRNSADAASA